MTLTAGTKLGRYEIRSQIGTVECYPCRDVSLNYSKSLLFHGGNTGSIPVRDANILKHFQHPTAPWASDR
jgi:hypothetical protein